MAREADCTHVNLTGDRAKAMERLERFAALVAAASASVEREACAKVVEQTKWSNWFQADCAAAIRARGQA
jgi:hypothetical protein